MNPSDEFPVHWDDPADAERTWMFDPMHSPDVVTPLSLDLYFQPFVEGFGMGFSLRAFNYYTYMNIAAEPPPESSPEETLNELSQAWGRWQDHILPEVQGHINYYRDTDFDSLSDSDLADNLHQLRKMRSRQGELHTMAVMPWMTAMTLLMDTHHELTGEGDISAARLVQGYGSKSVEAGQGLWNLSQVAASIPAVRSRLLEVTLASAPQCLADLRGDPGAKPFVDALSSYLEEFGWRSDLFEFPQPTWAEEPSIPLCQLRAYLEMEGYDPAEELRRLGEERDAAISKTMGSLEPEARERLQTILSIAREVVSLQEDHNFYIDQRLAMIPRRLPLAAGRRLASRGALDDPGDIFYLQTDEIAESLLSPENSRRELVSSRKQEMAHWKQATPPPFIGAPPPEEEGGPFARFFGERRLPSDQPNVLLGNGGSAGLARGPARVLQNLSEADRLKPGDVLVARTTMPAWTPLFAVASAIVVETGGILSHAAVTAREYRIPAVLAVNGAARLIRDGQLLEVDGEEGTVRILS